MLNRIKAFFADDRPPEIDQRVLAAACLMVEAARLDDHFDTAEREMVLKLLSQRFNLNAEEADTLLHLAEQRQEGAGGLFRFTHTVKEGFGPEDRVAIVEMLWDVAFADGEIHDYEANLIRRVAGLLYVSDFERGEARKRALARAGVQGKSGLTLQGRST